MQQELSGIIIINKPADITSAGVVSIVKKAFKAKKAGHTGTLDPFATGVLICCINKATKLSRFFLEGNKKYEAVLRLGETTDTDDVTGKIVSTCKRINFTEDKICSVFKQFEGVIEQVPPVYSALKHKGVPLYKLARKGTPVIKPARIAKIYYNKILEINLPEIRFEVLCSSGTYIRTFGSDIASILGCGGHIKELKRIENCGYTIDDAIELSEIEKLAKSENSEDKDRLSGFVIKMADALFDMPGYIADRALAKKIINGNLITKKDFKQRHFGAEKGFVRITDDYNNLLAVMSFDNRTDKFTYCCVFNN